MRLLMIEPLKHPKVIETDNLDLEFLQWAVGGSIEAVYPFADPVAVICNEEGKLKGLALNRPLLDEDDRIYDILCGTILVTGVGEEDFCGLSDELLEEYKKHFWEPKVFISDYWGKIFAFDYEEEPKKGDSDEKAQ